MDAIKRLHWPLIFGLGALALIRPLVSMIGTTLGLSDPPAVPIVLTIVISAAWIGIVGLTRVRHPVLTLVFTGLAYAVFATVFSATMSPILTGHLQGPLAMPASLVAVLVTNAIWGAITGLLALALQRARGFRPGPTQS